MPLVYLSGERKITIGPVCNRIEYKSVQFLFSFPLTGRSKGSEGVDFVGCFLGGIRGVEIGNAFLKKLGSDLVVQNSR